MKKTSKILALALVAMMLLTSLMVLPASAAEETKTYVFDPNTAEAATGLNGIVTAGTDDFFTLNMSNSKYESGKSHEFGAAVNNGEKAMRFSLNGTSKIVDETIQRSISFTTTGKATVNVYWNQGNSGERTLDLYNSNLELVTSESKAKGYYVSTFNLDEAGTYYLAHFGGTVYFFLVEVSVTVETCSHTGGTATCKDLAVCDLCGQPYGELSTEHNFVSGTCTVCGEPDPNACQHTNKNAATCLLPETCASCGETFGEALGHDMAEATCTTPATCKRDGCTHTEGDALGHTLTFTTTIPTGELKGKTTAACSVCDFTYESEEFGLMTPGTYVLEAATDLDGIAAGDYFNGEVKVVDGVFSCHLSAKYKTDTSSKSWIDYESGVRMNFGGSSEHLNNGEGDEAVRNGGLKNYILISTTQNTEVTIYWVCGGNGRQVALYDLEGNLVVRSNDVTVKNEPYLSHLEVPAGTYLIGADCTDAEGSGGNYLFKVVVDVHEHEWHDATCESPKYCDCGVEEGEALGHDMGEATCASPATCKREGCTHTEGEALGHTWVDATCESAKTCSVCGETEGDALGHTWTDATCESAKTCSVCGETEGDALGHDYVDGVCTRCEAADPDYVAPTLWEKIVAWFMALIQQILGFFKKA